MDSTLSKATTALKKLMESPPLEDGNPALHMFHEAQPLFKQEIANVEKNQEIEELKVSWLGKNGIVTTGLRNLGKLPQENRKTAGLYFNNIKEFISRLLQNKALEIQRKERQEALKLNRLDVTLPGFIQPVGEVNPATHAADCWKNPPSSQAKQIGGLHPLTIVTERLYDIFTGLGFESAAGPEIETDYYNFEALNIPSDHPSREMWDSFYLGGNYLMRTHTSPVQIHEMENREPPLRIVSAGKCYRRDAVDATHSYQFHQMEGFMVDTNVTFGDLKGVLSLFARQFFGAARKVRFRPSYFPFTEPSAEVDIDCFACNGSGCRLCGNSGWIEILGAGMIHPFVLRKAGSHFDPEKHTGFAFGMGIERLAMLSYGINDIRLFFENDLRFLEQFKYNEVE